MKKIYVLNLDAQRLVVLLGILLVFFSFALYLGMKLAENPNPTYSKSAEEIPVMVEKPPFSEPQGILTIPQPTPSWQEPTIETREQLNNTLPLQEDPFIQPPPKRKAEQHRSQNTLPKSTFYTIQVAAFLKEKDAKNLSTQLISQGYPARVEQGSKFWFVRVGKASHPEKLQRQANKLRSENYEVLIKKQEG